jgi:hypothetical protein
MHQHRARWRCWQFQRLQRPADAANPNPDFSGSYLTVTPPPACIRAAGGSFWEPTGGGSYQRRVAGCVVSAFQRLPLAE